MDVVVDEEEKTVLTTVGDMSQYPDGVRTVNLHDNKTVYTYLIGLKHFNNNLMTYFILLFNCIPFAETIYGPHVHVHYLKHSFI